MYLLKTGPLTCPYQRGELAKNALYWKDGMKEWLPVSLL